MTPMSSQLALPGAATLELPPVTAPIPAVEELLAALTAGGAGATCNFYAGADPDAGERRERLRRYLTAHWAAPVVLVGEAPGYRGARRSGIPFTSEHQVLGHGMREATATIVHQVLAELSAGAQVLLWNAVPYHPHRRGAPQSNRPPNAAEIAACRELLAAVIAGRAVVAAGRTAASTLHELGVAAAAVRHPSHGGKAAFAAGLAAVLAAEPAATVAARRPGGLP